VVVEQIHKIKPTEIQTKKKKSCKGEKKISSNFLSLSRLCVWLKAKEIMCKTKDEKNNSCSRKLHNSPPPVPSNKCSLLTGPAYA